MNRPSVYVPFARRFTDERARDIAETVELYNRVTKSHRASLWAQTDAIERVSNYIVEQVTSIVDLPTYQPLGPALDKCQRAVLELETTVFSEPKVDFSRPLSLLEQVDLSRHLRALEYFLAHQDRISEQLVMAIGNVLGGIISELPELPEESDAPTLTVPLITLIRDAGSTVDKIIGTLTSRELVDIGLFTTLQDRLYVNICLASGLSPDDEKHRRPFVTADQSELPPIELVETYLKGTPFLDLLLMPVPFDIPMSAQFQHHWIVAPPGTGKSTTLQFLLASDLELVARNQASVVVMESNRDLIKAIEGLKILPQARRSTAS